LFVCKIWCEKSSGSKSNCFWLGRTWKHHEVAKAQNGSELQSVTKIIIIVKVSSTRSLPPPAAQQRSAKPFREARSGVSQLGPNKPTLEDGKGAAVSYS